MAGLPLDEHLERALDSLSVGDYMSGITAEEVSRLLRG